ncbi:Solute carrier family 23 member 1 [Holothuria leucospilota]|uniref:Solute carrier family 23 member 1 n=1 Tax=Holothuria leucospilota TaxID=206669 RepID=A0A9Q1C3K8_HOLLE|nr:Solute carrier family 23 member 1 [Holothuria leucospilota]
MGVTGFISFMLRFVGPLSVAPVLMLLGISLTQLSWESCHSHWGVSVFTAGMIILFTQFLSKKKIPVIGFSREKGFHVVRTRFLLKYSMILATMSGWFLCWILTMAGAFSDDPSDRTYRARTDIANEVFNETPWIRFPYPGQVVWPRPSIAAFFGMFSAVIASIIESIGDYNACARICQIPSPPRHAVNRGIATEGLGGLLSCLWGTGTGTGSYSVNIVIIGITKVASRRVIQMAAIMMVVVACFQKLCSFFATMPDPVIGGTMIPTVGMLISVGISLLQKIDINSSRNLFVLGLSLFLGIMLPEYMQNNPGIIHTGLSTFDKCATILLETGIFVGFITGLVFDNVIPDLCFCCPGTLMERGLLHNQQSKETAEHRPGDPDDKQSCYNLPVGMNSIRRWRFCRFVPISPTFRGFPRLRRASSR